MKFSAALATVLAVAPLALAVPANNNINNQKGFPDPKSIAASKASSSAASKSTGAAKNVAVASSTSAAAGAAASGATDNPQTSLCLDPSVIMPAAANNGQEGTPEAGQVASLTTTNNFINFCIDPSLGGQPITNGEQQLSGSCNPIPMGQIPAKASMPSTKFLTPPNLSTVAPNTTFNITMNIAGMATGFFTNAASTYYMAPQQLNAQGTINGHSHITVQQIASLTDTTPPDTTKFAFFKGLDDPAQGGQLSATVTGGLAAGVYRCCSITTSANHVPVLMPVAQHGNVDDCTYFTVSADAGAGAAAASSAEAAGGAAAATGAGAGAAASTTAAAGGAAASSSSAAAGAASSAAAKNGKQGGNGGKQGGNGGKQSGNKGGRGGNRGGRRQRRSRF